MEPTPPATLTAAPSFIPPALHRGTRARTREAQQGAYFDRSGLLFLQLTIYPAAHYKPLTGQINGDPQGGSIKHKPRIIHKRFTRRSRNTGRSRTRSGTQGRGGEIINSSALLSAGHCRSLQPCILIFTYRGTAPRHPYRRGSRRKRRFTPGLHARARGWAFMQHLPPAARCLF